MLEQDAGGSDQMSQKRLSGPAIATGEEAQCEVVGLRDLPDFGLGSAACAQFLVKLQIGLSVTVQSFVLSAL